MGSDDVEVFFFVLVNDLFLIPQGPAEHFPSGCLMPEWGQSVLGVSDISGNVLGVGQLRVKL